MAEAAACAATGSEAGSSEMRSRTTDAEGQEEHEAKQAAAREAAKQVWLWVRNFAETFTSPSQVPPVL